LDKINGVTTTGATPATVPAPAAAAKKSTKAAAPAVSMTDDEELENSFPSYEDGQAPQS
jgi:hypothetical protein